MPRRTVVFRSAGDAELGGAIINGMMKPLTSEELETVKAELAAVKAENAELGVRKVRDEKTFARKIRKSRRKYRPPRQATKVEEVLLIGWALTSLTIQEVYRRLSAWNRAA